MASRRIIRSEEAELEETQYEVRTENCGYLNVYVQGDIESINPRTPVFLTVHDLGVNHQAYHQLVEHSCMKKIKSRSVWIHVDMPGQEYDSLDLPPYFEFPKFDKICSDLNDVLEYFDIEWCVTLGEGAGANILARFSMIHPKKVLGNILINCAPNVESMGNFFQEKLMSWRLNTFGMNATADQYLVFHRFGMYLDQKKDLDKERTIEEFVEKMHKRMNPKNLRLFVNAYLNRSDMTSMIKENLKVDTLLACGSFSSLMQCTDEMQALMDPKITTRLNIEHCGSVLDDAPEIFAANLLLFCQGLGLFSSLPISRESSICAY